MNKIKLLWHSNGTKSFLIGLGTFVFSTYLVSAAWNQGMNYQSHWFDTVCWILLYAFVLVGLFLGIKGIRSNDSFSLLGIIGIFINGFYTIIVVLSLLMFIFD